MDSDERLGRIDRWLKILVCSAIFLVLTLMFYLWVIIGNLPSLLSGFMLLALFIAWIISIVAAAERD
jgi:uncharacterized membrane protein